MQELAPVPLSRAERRAAANWRCAGQHAGYFVTHDGLIYIMGKGTVMGDSAKQLRNVGHSARLAWGRRIGGEEHEREGLAGEVLAADILATCRTGSDDRRAVP